MSIQKDIKLLEQELFRALEYSFGYVETRNYTKLKVALEAIRQIELDYASMTKKNFINKENIDRLYAALDKLKETFDEDQKVLNEIAKKLK